MPAASDIPVGDNDTVNEVIASCAPIGAANACQAPSWPSRHPRADDTDERGALPVGQRLISMAA